MADVLAGRSQWWIEPCDVRAGLRMLPDESVQMVCTSPPYWGLRAYGTEPQVWGGGDTQCEHEWGQVDARLHRPGQHSANGLPTPHGETRRDDMLGQCHPAPSICQRCGAWRGELGSEPDPDLFVAHLIAIFREVRRVLKPDGVLFVNLGDSYAGSGKGPSTSLQPAASSPSLGVRIGSQHGESGHTSGVTPPSGLKPKDLVMVPFRFALAAQADSWWVRDDIVWAKKSTMPESVTDRCTRAHEFIFHLTKSRRYYWNADAIAEPAENAGRSVVDDGTQKNCLAGDDVNDFRTRISRPITVGATRNMRDVWHIGPEGLRDEHYAAFPTEIPRRCILAGSREGDIVLDPFAGSGTTPMVALRHGRRAIGLELNPEYVAMARRRITADAPLFNGIGAPS